MSRAVVACELLESLIGKQIETATGQLNIALRIDGDNVKKRKDPPERALPGERWSSRIQRSRAPTTLPTIADRMGRERTPVLSGIHDRGGARRLTVAPMPDENRGAYHVDVPATLN